MFTSRCSNACLCSALTSSALCCVGFTRQSQTLASAQRQHAVLCLAVDRQLFGILLIYPFCLCTAFLCSLHVCFLCFLRFFFLQKKMLLWALCKLTYCCFERKRREKGALVSPRATSRGFLLSIVVVNFTNR